MKGKDVFAHRDAIHKALGSPAIKPSMTRAIEMAFEGLEETAFENGQKHEKGREFERQWELLQKVLAHFEKQSKDATITIFDRDKWREALTTVRSDEEIPF